MTSSSVSVSTNRGIKSLFISDLRSKTEGGGTEEIQKIVARSLKDFGGRIRLDAAWGSDLFHLKMGFTPTRFDKRREWADEMYGMVEMGALNVFLKCVFPYKNEWNSQDPEIKVMISRVKSILSVELNKTKNEITNEDIEQNHQLLLQLCNEGIPLADLFATKLAERILKHKEAHLRDPHYNPLKSTKDINTKNLISKFPSMELSEMGRERWRKAIESEEKFAPFRDLSPLFAEIQRPYVKALLLSAIQDCPVFVIGSK